MRAEQNRNPPRPRAFVSEPCVHAGSYCLMRTMNRLFVPSRVMYPTKRRRRRNRAGAEPRFLDRRECYIMSPPRVHSVQGDRFPGACVARYACPGHSRVGRKSAAIPVRIRTRSTYCAIWHVKCPRFFLFQSRHEPPPRVVRIRIITAVHTRTSRLPNGLATSLRRFENRQQQRGSRLRRQC